jgi:cysteine desulfurase/selenocysteine lyase
MNQTARKPVAPVPARMPTTVAEARKLFPGAQRQIYMDVAGRGLLSEPVREAIDAYLDMRYDGGNKPAMFGTVERAREKFAQLIGCAPDEVAFTKNVSEGLNIIAASLDWKAGDNVVLCSDLEHANNVYVWLNLARNRGVEIRAIPMQDGHYPVDAMIAAMDARTRVVTACTVSFVPGFRTDVDALAAACRKRGALLLLDGAQSAGMVDINVARQGIDALAVSTQKGLLGLYGMGFLYVKREWAERMAPAYLARFGVDLGSAGEAALGDADYTLMPGAKRFDLGNYNFLGATAAERALDLLLAVGVPTIEAHLKELAGRLGEGLAALGLPVCGAPRAAYRAQIVVVGNMGTGHDAADDARMQSLYDDLVAHHVNLSIRKGALRFSLHLYNNTDDVDRVIALARDWTLKR